MLRNLCHFLTLQYTTLLLLVYLNYILSGFSETYHVQGSGKYQTMQLYSYHGQLLLVKGYQPAKVPSLANVEAALLTCSEGSLTAEPLCIGI